MLRDLFTKRPLNIFIFIMFMLEHKCKDWNWTLDHAYKKLIVSSTCFLMFVAYFEIIDVWICSIYENEFCDWSEQHKFKPKIK